MKKIKITIAGETNTGKSRITYLIKEALLSKGFIVEFEDFDFGNGNNFDKAMSINFDKTINTIKEKTKIIIEQVQLKKEMF